jgi:hypothetical protein
MADTAADLKKYARNHAESIAAEVGLSAEELNRVLHGRPMTQIAELYTALLKAGLEEGTARAAATSVMGVQDYEQLATKADLRELRSELHADMGRMQADIIKWNLVILGFMTALFSGLVTLLK